MLHLSTCTIRPWRPGDEPSLATHADDREVWLNVRDRFPRPYTLEHARKWIERASPETSFAIEVDGAAVGGIGLMPQHDVERIGAELGYWLGREYWGRGIATDAVRAITDYAFASFDLARVYAIPFARNAASIRVLEKCGYHLEGVLRRNAIKDGVILDSLMYSRIREPNNANPSVANR